MPDRERNHSRWIGKRIHAFKMLAHRTRCNVVLVAHPTKLERNKDGEQRVPDGDNIADSRFFYSMSEIGFTVHRPDTMADGSFLDVWKARYRRFSHYGRAGFRVDGNTGRVFPALVDIARNQRSWHDLDDEMPAPAEVS